MANLILMLLRSLLTGLRNQAVMQAEIIALRHQLIVLQRTQKANRLVLGRADRCLWVWLSRLWSRWRSALIIVKPETVIGWHRQGFQWYWAWKIRHGRSGRPRSVQEQEGATHEPNVRKVQAIQRSSLPRTLQDCCEPSISNIGVSTT
jgi:hypothetical protein